MQVIVKATTMPYQGKMRKKGTVLDMNEKLAKVLIFTGKVEEYTPPPVPRKAPAPQKAPIESKPDQEKGEAKPKRQYRNRQAKVDNKAVLESEKE